MPMATYNITDFAISGAGFFVVYDEINNIKYLTRNGRFLFNGRWILTNDTGYFVLGYDGNYIDLNRFDEARGHFENFFLIALPVIEAIKRVTSMYIYASEFVSVDINVVYNGMLESNPVLLSELLNTALLDLGNNRGFNNRQGLIDLFYRRYYEMISLIPENIFYEDYEYYSSVLTKIQLLEELLFDLAELRQ